MLASYQPNAEQSTAIVRVDAADWACALAPQLKLKDLIISSFVPREECEKVKKRAVWDDEHEG